MPIVEDEDVDSPYIGVIQRAKDLRRNLDEAELRARIEELESVIDTYREEYNHYTLEDADQFGDINREDVQEWAQLRADKAVAKLALRLSEAVSSLETATADRDDWSGTTPADAGESAFGDSPESIEDMPDLGRTPLPDHEDEGSK
jgi:hypothetical protein